MAWHSGRPAFKTKPASKEVRENFEWLKTQTDGLLASRLSEFSVVTDDNPLPTAIADAGADPTTIVIQDERTLTGDVTVPANVDLWIPQGGMLSGAHTITINGPFDAGLYQVFDSDVTVVFGTNAISAIVPEWRGAVADDITDNLIPLTWALTSGHSVKLSEGRYKYSALITVTSDSFSMFGVGRDKSVLYNIGTTGAIKFQCNDIDIRDCQILGQANSGSGLIFDDSSAGYTGKEINLTNLKINSHGTHGLTWIGGDDRYSSYINITDCGIGGNVIDAVNSEGAQTVNTITIKGCKINGTSADYVANGSDGIVIGKGQTLALLGNSLQSFVNCVRYGEEATSSGFVSHGNYFEDFTEAGIRLGAGACVVTGIDIGGDYYHCGSITNVTEGAGIRIYAGHGMIAGNAVSFESATKKYIYLDSAHPHYIHISQFYETDYNYSAFDVARLAYTGMFSFKKCMGPQTITQWDEANDRSDNLYGAGGTFYFQLDVSPYDIIDSVRSQFVTDNADATIDMTLYKRNMSSGSAKIQVATLGAAITTGVKTLDCSEHRVVRGASGEEWGYIVKVVVVDDGAGGSSTLFYTPYVRGSF